MKLLGYAGRHKETEAEIGGFLLYARNANEARTFVRFLDIARGHDVGEDTLIADYTVNRCHRLDPFVIPEAIAPYEASDGTDDEEIQRKMGYQDEGETPCIGCGLCAMALAHHNVCYFCKRCPACKVQEEGNLCEEC